MNRTGAAAPQWRFLLVLLLPAGLLQTVIALSAGASPWRAWLPLLAIHAAVPLLDWLLGADGRAPVPGRPHPLNRWLLLACLPAWLVAFGGAAALAPTLDGWAWWGLAASAGATGGIVAINVGHELVHRATRFDRAVGGWLLATVGYGAFKVEHVRGHHLRVATPDDPATARIGESLWHFVPRSVAGTLTHAWRLETARVAARHPGPGPRRALARLLHHETAGWTAASLALAIAAGAAWGMASVGFLAAAAAIAVFELELVNYIEHYGLRRARTADGRWEPVDHRHSWNADTAVVNAFLLNLQRHSDHHAHGGKPYTALDSDRRAPQMPAGYGAMVLLALVPPLWRAVMDRRIAGYGASAGTAR